MTKVINGKINPKRIMTPLECIETAISIYITNLLILKYGIKNICFNLELFCNRIIIKTDDETYEKIKKTENEVVEFINTIKINKIERS